MKFKKTIFIMLLTGLILSIPGPGDLTRLAGNSIPVMTLVVDAGHGGPDGGAQALDGTAEADINLAIAKAIEKEAQKRNIKVVMIRNSEDGLYAEENLERKWRKLEDMSQRKRRIESANADAAVTIHMNSFPEDTSVRGAQVFYPKVGNEEVLQTSELLAECVQKHLILGLQDGSNRVHMAKGSVLLLENPPIPTILVECGFLSNQDDLARLQQSQWQEQIAVCVVDGLLEGMEIKIEKNERIG